MTDQLQVFANYLPCEKVIRLVHKLSFFWPSKAWATTSPELSRICYTDENRQSVHLFQPQETNSVFEKCFLSKQTSSWIGL